MAALGLITAARMGRDRPPLPECAKKIPIRTPGQGERPLLSRRCTTGSIDGGMVLATYPDPADFATDETGRLIASNKVEGTAVYNREGERLGSVYNSMVDKVSGQVAYAVMSLGGFLGIGDGYHPLPWKSLTYDTSMGGCVVDLDRSRLEEAPSYRSLGGSRLWPECL